jgi:alpha-mannosidase
VPAVQSLQVEKKGMVSYMKVKDPYYKIEKIRKYLDEDIYGSRVRSSINLDKWKYTETSMEEKIQEAYEPAYDDTSWADFQLWDSWGGYDKVAWFRCTVTIPDEFLGKQIAFKGIIGPRDGGGSTAETLLYINGKPVQAIDIWHEEAFLDPEIYRNTRELQISLKCWSGVLNVPRARVFKDAQLIVVDTKVDKFFHTMDTLLKCVNLLEESDLRRIRLTKLMTETFQKVNFLNIKKEEYYQSIYQALEYVQCNLAEYAKGEEIKPTVTAVGHSHIDMGWLWRYSATREKASRTFSTVLNLMRIIPEYRFMHSSPQLYKMVKEDYPEIYEKIKTKIGEGQWEITGGMWVEADTNIPNGESLVRQFLFGKRYMKEEFGMDSKLLWLPDVFGYSAALPQIMKKSDMDYFMTTKISWNQYNVFPYDTFLWKGIDGSEIFTHFITTPENDSWFYTYNGTMEPHEVTGIWKNYKDKDKNEELLLAFGWGDGGGGPTREMLERIRVMENIPGIPKVQIDTTESYFNRIYNQIDHQQLGTWEGELYFELHRGTYTSQSYTKRANRKAEGLMHDLEFVSVLADAVTKKNNYPQEEINQLWEKLLLNQFHDVLPGSSIRQVYEDCKVIYEEIETKGAYLLNEGMKRILPTASAGKESVLIFNTTGWKRNDVLLLPYSNTITKESRFNTAEGIPVMIQCTEEGILLFVEAIPAYGYQKLIVATHNELTYSDIIVEKTHLENKFFIIDLNDGGEIISLVDKRNKRQLCCGKPMNVLCAFEDKPVRFDAWDIDIFYKDKPYNPMELLDIQVIETGPVRGTLRLTWRFNESIIRQDVMIYQDKDRIDFKTYVDWKEKQVLLKAFFPVDIHTNIATFDIQFGNIQRPTHTNTEWDFARFEVSAHKWVDLSEGDYGVTLLNDCKYGHDVHNNIIGLTLIKSAIQPDETADRCEHYFTYSLYPHAGTWQQSEVQQSAMELNLPLQCLEANIKEGELNSFELLATESDHIVIDTIKKAEEDNAILVRLYEYKNRKEKGVSLQFGVPIDRVIETNLIERELNTMEVKDDSIVFDITGYEVKTFKVYLKA